MVGLLLMKESFWLLAAICLCCVHMSEAKETVSPFESAKKNGLETTIVAGGCFWGVEYWIAKQPGVIDTRVGYAGGSLKGARYESVRTGKTGHAESVQVLFDPKKISYETLLLYFFKIHDPTTLNQQGGDRGTQYRSTLFYSDDKQKEVAEKVRARVEKSGKWGKPLVTEIVPTGIFVEAEPEHQKYLKQNPGGYNCHFPREIEF